MDVKKGKHTNNDDDNIINNTESKDDEENNAFLNTSLFSNIEEQQVLIAHTAIFLNKTLQAYCRK